MHRLGAAESPAHGVINLDLDARKAVLAAADAVPDLHP